MEEYTAATVQELTQAVVHASVEELLRAGARRFSGGSRSGSSAATKG
jgi:hypothetical protein